MPKTQIEIAVKGVDNASKVLQDVRGQLDGLNRKVVEAGQVGKQATSVVSAGFSALNGSITGAVSGARGMASAIQAMGVAMNTAMPIAAAVSAALFAIKKAYDAVQAARQQRIDDIKAETAALTAYLSTARALMAQQEKEARQRGRMTSLFADVAGYGDERKKREEGRALADDLRGKEKVSIALQNSIITARNQINDVEWKLDSTLYSDKEKEAIRGRVESLRKAMESDVAALAGLTDDIEYLRLQIENNARQQRELAEKRRQKEADEAYAKIKDAAEEWLKVEEVAEEAEKQLRALAQRRDAEIEAFNRASFARSVSQATAGARSVSMEEVAKVAALQAAGFVRSSATGYTTSQGDAMREAEARAKTERYQEEMLSLVRSMEKKADVQQGGLGLDVMSF